MDHEAPTLHPSTLSPLQLTVSWIIIAVAVPLMAAATAAVVHDVGWTGAPVAVLVLVDLLVLALLVRFARRRPLGVALARDAITLVRPHDSITLDRNDVARVSILDRRALGTPIRLAGAGGYFGHHGIYWTRKHGRFAYHATEMAAEHIGIEDTRGKRWVATVDDVDAFVRDALDKGWTIETDVDDPRDA